MFDNLAGSVQSGLSAVRFDLSALISLAVAGAALASAWGALAERDAAQDRAISSLESALLRERAERMAVQDRFDRLLMDGVADRAMWALGRRRAEHRD